MDASEWKRALPSEKLDMLRADGLMHPAALALQWPAEREHVFDIIESLMDRISELESRASGLP